MADKMNLSKETSSKLDHLSARLDLRRNIITRIAIGRSFSMESPVETEVSNDRGGYEFNRPTVMGSDEYIFRAIATNIQGYAISDDIFFNIVIRNHVERGIQSLHDEYNQINSPVQFIERLIGQK